MNNNKEMIELGKRIKNAREDAGLTQDQLHLRSKISITQISSFENGKRNIGLRSLHAIARALGKTMDELYDGSIEQRPVSSAKNIGELVVNCIDALFREQVISVIQVENIDQHNFQPTYEDVIWFTKYKASIEELIDKLNDFEENKANYPDPAGFREQILAASVNQINNSK